MPTNENRNICLITGATGKIGEAIASRIALDGAYEVYLACRDEARGARTAARIREKSGNENVRVVAADLSSGASLRKLAASWEGPLHLLVNNAATAPRSRRETEEGLEMQFAVNVLGYFRMMHFFEKALRRSEAARVVNVASYWAGGLDLNDPQFQSRAYNNDAAYRQSKQADRMLTRVFAERFRDANITVNSCHPGDVRSQLSSDLGFGGHQTPEEAARTPVMLALDPALDGKSGGYYASGREADCAFCRDESSLAKLYEYCLRLA